MNTNTPINENAADALYDAATAQYALHTLEQLRREYDLASPDEQEAIDSLIERGAQIVFNSDLPEAYVTVDQWTQIRPHKWGIGDWSDAIRPRCVPNRQRGARHLPGDYRTPDASQGQARRSHSTVRMVRASRR